MLIRELKEGDINNKFNIHGCYTNGRI
jgi:hypothetical protein